MELKVIHRISEKLQVLCSYIYMHFIFSFKYQGAWLAQSSWPVLGRTLPLPLPLNIMYLTPEDGHYGRNM